MTHANAESRLTLSRVRFSYSFFFLCGLSPIPSFGALLVPLCVPLPVSSLCGVNFCEVLCCLLCYPAFELSFRLCVCLLSAFPPSGV